MHPNIADVNNTLLAIIDMQQAFCDKVHAFDALMENSVKLVQACAILKLPIIVTEQYPKGLGQTFSDISKHIQQFEPLEKTSFNAFDDRDFRLKLQSHSPEHIIVIGMETHICISQTVHALLDAGYTVHVPQDATASRKNTDVVAGIGKMRDSGAIISSVETIVFELLGNSKYADFKKIQALFK